MATQQENFRSKAPVEAVAEEAVSQKVEQVGGILYEVILWNRDRDFPITPLMMRVGVLLVLSTEPTGCCLCSTWRAAPAWRMRVLFLS